MDALVSSEPLRAAPDGTVVRAVAEGSQPAIGELYDRYSPMLLGLARKILGSTQDAEETLQEVFLHVWSQAGRYDPRRSSVSTWLVLITRSRAIDRLRSRRVSDRTHTAAQKESSREHASAEGAARVLHAERRRRVQEELAQVPAEQRQVLELAFYEGLTQSEIAETTGIPLGTVKTRTLLAMKKLRKALRDEIRELL